MPDGPSLHHDLHVHLRSGEARLVLSGLRGEVSSGLEVEPLLTEAAAIQDAAQQALEGAVTNAARSLEDIDQRTCALGLALGEALGTVGRELATYSGFPRVRLWVHAHQELQPLPFEALSFAANRGLARVSQLMGWQVLRARELRPESSASDLRRVIVIVGDCRPLNPTNTYETRTAVEKTVQGLRAAMGNVTAEFHVCAAMHAIAPHYWNDLGAQVFTGGHDLHLRAGAEHASDSSLVVVLGHSTSDLPEENGERPRPQRSPTSLLLNADAGDLSRRSLPVVAIAAQGRPTLGELLPEGTRLCLFLGCHTGEGFAAELPQVDHVVGTRCAVPFDLLAEVGGEVLGALCRPGSATVGEAVRLARRRLGLLATSSDPAGVLRPLWWAPAHWPAVAKDNAFLDPDAMLLAEYRRALVPHLEGLEGDMRLQRRALTQVAVDLHVSAGATGSGSGDGSQSWLEGLDRAPLGGAEGGLWKRERTLLDLLVETPADRPPQARAGAWVIKGPAGSGKSTAARDLVHQLAEGSLGLLPVYIGLADWSAEPRGRDLGSLLRYLCHSLGLGSTLDQGPGPAAALEQWMRREQRRCVLVLDGLDECGARRDDAEKLLVNLRTALPRAAVVVTTRPADYRPIAQYTELLLQPLRPDQMEELLWRWYQAELPIDEARARAEADLRTIESKEPALRELAQLPLFLNLMAQLLLSGGRLEATRRHEFLRQMLGWMLDGKHRRRPQPFRHPSESSTDRTRRILRAIAYELCRRRSTEWSHQDLCDWLEHHAPEPIRGAAPFGPGAFLESASGNGLLRPALASRPDGPWRFLHRAFQEALAAEELREFAARSPRTLEPLLARAAELLAEPEPVPASDGEEATPLDFWREPFALLAGYLNERGSAWIQALLGQEPTRQVGLSAIGTVEGLSSDALGQALNSCTNTDERLLVYEPLGARLGQGPRVVDVLLRRGFELTDDFCRRYDREVRHELWWLLDCLDSIESRAGPPVTKGDASKASRAILDRLPELSDSLIEMHFFRVPGRNEPLWVEVPAGIFLMGSPESEEGRLGNEGQVQVQLDSFHIARTPVTRAQYDLYDQEKTHWWGSDPHFPMTGVTWFESALFCRWLDHRGAALRERIVGASKRGNWRLWMPSEAQWEYACRGAPGLPRTGERGYPRFVDGIAERDLARVAWWSDNSGRQVHAVASAPAPSSRLKLWDMLGNISEWTASRYARVLCGGLNPVGPSWVSTRVMRSGSFHDTSAECRAAYRCRWEPHDRNSDLGFRLSLVRTTPD
jgi:formylglycine-generating enzyme required for sulfatase activity